MSCKISCNSLKYTIISCNSLLQQIKHGATSATKKNLQYSGPCQWLVQQVFKGRDFISWMAFPLTAWAQKHQVKKF